MLRIVVVTAALALLFVAAPAASAADAPTPGETAYVGMARYFNGSAFMFPIYLTPPADPDAPGEPDFWAYCIEHDIGFAQNTTVQLGNLDSFLGENLFSTDTEVPGLVLWILANSYPAVALDDLGAASGVEGLTQEAAIEATTTALWRFTDLGYDAPWAWEYDGAATVYGYLVAGAQGSGGLSPSDFTTTVTVSAPADAQIADSLIGPFTVQTNQPFASVTSTPALPIVNSDGDTIDPDAVTSGTEIYLDARGFTDSGTATVTAAVPGSSAMGLVGSVPAEPGDTPTAEDRAQSFMVVAAAGSRTVASATADWAALPTTPESGSSTEPSPTDDASTASSSVDTASTEPSTESTAPSTESTDAPLAATGVTTQAWTMAAAAILLIGLGALLTMRRNGRTRLH